MPFFDVSFSHWGLWLKSRSKFSMVDVLIVVIYYMSGNHDEVLCSVLVVSDVVNIEIVF